MENERDEGREYEDSEIYKTKEETNKDARAVLSRRSESTPVVVVVVMVVVVLAATLKY